MHFSIKNLNDLKEKVNKKVDELRFHNYSPNIIAVSKTFAMDKITPLLAHGHIHFGENKVQEAVEKWSLAKKEYTDCKLHMIGRLQTNKVKLAVKIFDFIHSVDSIKLAKKISEEQIKIKKNIGIFLQVNVAGESQKSGVDINSLSNLYEECINLNLNVLGLMCIPPISEPAGNYFEIVSKKKNELKLSSHQLSYLLG